MNIPVEVTSIINRHVAFFVIIRYTIKSDFVALFMPQFYLSELTILLIFDELAANRKPFVDYESESNSRARNNCAIVCSIVSGILKRRRKNIFCQ